jgi:hypothetical protein
MLVVLVQPKAGRRDPIAKFQALVDSGLDLPHVGAHQLLWVCRTRRSFSNLRNR